MKHPGLVICMACMLFAPIFGCWYTFGLYTEADGDALIEEFEDYLDGVDSQYGERTKTDENINRNLISVAIDIVTYSSKYKAADENQKQDLLNRVEAEVVKRGYISDDDIYIDTNNFSFEDKTGALCVGKTTQYKLY